jgi:hypothetical protein
MKANDEKCLIAMPSLTGAMGAERFLGTKGLRVRVLKLPQGSTKKGCAYGLEIPCAVAQQGVKLLDGARIKHGDLL